MDKQELRDSFLGSLQKMYDMELAAPLMEFCQGEMRVLLYLDSHKNEKIYPSALSESLFVTRQRITSILSSLRKKGYLTMQTAEADRRRMQVQLSPAGRQYVLKKRQLVESYFDQILDALGEENMQQFQRLIQLTAEKMEGLSR